MAKHTPGPWWAGSDEDAHMVYTGDCEAVASTLRDDGDSIAEEANAKLIAAAPDLLEALKAVVSVADRKTDEFDLAHAAIAKAEGPADA